MPDARVDQTRIDCAHIVDIEPQSVAAVGEKVGDEHIGGGEQFVEHCSTRGRGEVESDRSLVAVELLPHERQVIVAVRQTGHGLAAHWVGEGRVDDLDDVRAPVAEYCRARRTEREHGDFDDSDAFEHGRLVDHARNVLAPTPIARVPIS